MMLQNNLLWYKRDIPLFFYQYSLVSRLRSIFILPLLLPFGHLILTDLPLQPANLSVRLK